MLPAATPFPPLRSAKRSARGEGGRQRGALDRLRQGAEGLLAGDAGVEKLVQAGVGLCRIGVARIDHIARRVDGKRRRRGLRAAEELAAVDLRVSERDQLLHGRSDLFRGRLLLRSAGRRAHRARAVDWIEVSRFETLVSVESVWLR